MTVVSFVLGFACGGVVIAAWILIDRVNDMADRST